MQNFRSHCQGTTMNTLDELLAINAIEGTKARYCRFMDTKRWNDWGMLFTENATLDVSEDVTPEMGPQVVHGRSAIVAQVCAASWTAPGPPIRYIHLK